MSIENKLSPKKVHISNKNVIPSLDITNHLYKRIKKELPMLIKEIKECEENLTYDENLIKKSLKVDINERTIYDLAQIKKFLLMSKLAEKFRSDNIENENLDRILFFVSLQLKYSFLEDDKILFRIGDKPDKFYLILTGRIGIFKPIEVIETFSGMEYFRYIYKLKIDNEIYLLNLILDQNRHIFDVKFEDLDNINNLLLSNLIDDFFINPSQFNFEDILTYCFKDKNYFHLTIDHEQKKDPAYMSEIEYKIYKKLPKISKYIIDNYKSFLFNKQKQKVKINKYHKFLELSDFDFFGDSAMDKTTTRNATIKACVDTSLCYLDIKDYTKYLKDEKIKITQKEVRYLIDNFFFKNIIDNYFEKKFLAKFIYEEKVNGERFFKEGTPVDYLYFIREGLVTLEMNNNLLDIYNLIMYLKEILNDNYTFNYRNQKNDFYSLLSKLNESKKNLILTVHNKDTIAIESLFFGLNYLFTATAASKKVKYYKISIDDLFKIFDEEEFCYNRYKNDCYKKITVIYHRLIQIFNTKLEMIDKEKSRSINLSENKYYNFESLKIKNGEIIEYEDKNTLRSFTNYGKNFLRIFNETSKKIKSIGDKKLKQTDKKNSLLNNVSKFPKINDKLEVENTNFDNGDELKKKISSGEIFQKQMKKKGRTSIKLEEFILKKVIQSDTMFLTTTNNSDYEKTFNKNETNSSTNLNHTSNLNSLYKTFNKKLKNKINKYSIFDNKFGKIFNDEYNNSKKIDSTEIVKSHQINRTSSNNLNETSSSSYQQIFYEELPNIKINAFNEYFKNNNKFKGKIQFSSKNYLKKLNKFKSFRNKMEQTDYWKK